MNFFPFATVCFYHITMWYRVKLAQVSVCDINLELLFGCHHWPCHRFVTCLLDFVNSSWVSQITFIPVECACTIGMRASPLRPPHKAIIPEGVVAFSGFVRLIKAISPLRWDWGDGEDSKNVRGRSTPCSYLIVRLIFWSKICSGPFKHAFSLSNMMAEFSSKLKGKVFMEPQNSSPQHLFALIEWLSMCEKKMEETKRISEEWPYS